MQTIRQIIRSSVPCMVKAVQGSQFFFRHINKAYYKKGEIPKKKGETKMYVVNEMIDYGSGHWEYESKVATVTKEDAEYYIWMKALSDYYDYCDFFDQNCDDPTVTGLEFDWDYDEFGTSNIPIFAVWADGSEQWRMTITEIPTFVRP